MFSSVSPAWCDIDFGEPVKPAPKLSDEEKEARLGNALDIFIRQIFVILNDSSVSGRIAQTSERLVKASSRPDMEIRAHVICDATPMAFTAPGGHVYVSTGLLDILRSEDELASVLAGPIALMVDRDHYNSFTADLKKRERAQLVGTLFMIGFAVAGGVAVAAAGGAASAGGGLATMPSPAIQMIGTVDAVVGAGIQSASSSMEVPDSLKLPEKTVYLNRANPIYYMVPAAYSLATVMNEAIYGNPSDSQLHEAGMPLLKNAGYDSNALAAVQERLNSLKDLYAAKGYTSNLLRNGEREGQHEN
jgi:predicted Zn-dependent protease